MDAPVATAPPLIAPLDAGPVDVIGDVHGEFDALRELLAVLGYDDAGEHPAGRRLVFVGDLGDRGPDSPSVYAFVDRLIGRGLAACVLGNHELNLLRGARKDGNGWFFADDHDHPRASYGSYRRATASERAQILDLIARMPLVLERNDLRVTHAAWVPDAITALRTQAGRGTLPLYHEHEHAIRRDLSRKGVDRRADAERIMFGHCLRHREARLPFLEAIGQMDLEYQMGNPIRVLTSGVERLAAAPYFLAGQWRMVERVPWWDAYDDDVPVIVGHYWRAPDDRLRLAYANHSNSLFGDSEPTDWLGRRRRVFCVDFSIGGRYTERRRGLTGGFATRLAAVRWPERELVFEDGLALTLGGTQPAGVTG
jgi:hypothetical protein